MFWSLAIKIADSLFLCQKKSPGRKNRFKKSSVYLLGSKSKRDSFFLGEAAQALCLVKMTTAFE